MSWEGELSDTEMSIVTGGRHMRDDVKDEMMSEAQLSPQRISKTEMVRIPVTKSEKVLSKSNRY